MENCDSFYNRLKIVRAYAKKEGNYSNVFLTSKMMKVKLNYQLEISVASV